MNPNLRYAYTILSLLFIFSWGYFIFETFIGAPRHWFIFGPAILYLTIIAGFVGAIVLILLRTLRYRRLQYNFFYNFCGTLNLLVGSVLLINPSQFFQGNQSFAPAYFSLGLYIYHDIFYKKRIPKQG